jgi:hypothetical protein
MKWYKLALLTFSVVFLVLIIPTISEAGFCHYKCAPNDQLFITESRGCGYCFEQYFTWGSGTSRCMINKDYQCTDWKGCAIYSHVDVGTSSCPDGVPPETVPNTCKCKTNACPEFYDWEGAPCIVELEYWKWSWAFWESGCRSYKYEGVWDANQSQCIVCDGPFKAGWLGDKNKFIGYDGPISLMCKGNPHNCEWYNSIENKNDRKARCEAAGCYYSNTFNRCYGRPKPCNKFLDSYSCEKAGCEVNKVCEKACDPKVGLCDGKYPGYFYAENFIDPAGIPGCINITCGNDCHEDIRVYKASKETFAFCDGVKCKKKIITHDFYVDDGICKDHVREKIETIDNCVCDDGRGVSCNSSHVETTIIEGFTGTPDYKCEAAAYDSSDTKVKNSNCTASPECDEKSPGEFVETTILEDGYCDYECKYKQLFEIYRPFRVPVNKSFEIPWLLGETLESPEKCGKEQYRCHTNLHCFPPGANVPVADDIKGWVDDCDPYVGRPSTPCVSSSMVTQTPTSIYDGWLYFDKLGNWTCRIHLRNKRGDTVVDIFSKIFQIEAVEEIPTIPTP